MNFKKNESAQKLRGGYYTPSDLALFLSKWVAEVNPKSILEPSCGDGVFLETLASFLTADTEICGIELNESEATKARERAHALNGPSINILSADFLEWYLSPNNRDASFDAVVGNPPFIRYQYLSEQDQEYSEKIFKKHGLRFTKHTNAWVPFVIASLSLLKSGGRLAMVLPAEILHVLHAQSLRQFLGQHCQRMIIIDPEEIWFEGTLQGAVLLLAEKKLDSRSETTGLGIIPTVGKSFLQKNPSDFFENTDFINGKTVEGKWTRALLTKNELDIFEQIAANIHVHKFADIAKVDVGIVTGANSFFLVNDDKVRKHGLSKWSHPMFGRSGHCPGILYDEQQHESNSNSGLPSNFLWFDVNDASELSAKVREYICMGEKEELHTRYKCRIRNPWFKVPSVHSTSVGMLKRAHDMPRLIYNELEAYTTDTAYRIKAKKVENQKLVYCFINSFTALSAELEGRHYGGGVLELVPSEIERVYIPIPRGLKVSLKSLDKLIRTSPASVVLAHQDAKVLKGIGISLNEIVSMQNAWDRLRNRRQRKPNKASKAA